MIKPKNIHLHKGFTLIELMIVMTIVALLMGMVGPLAINSLEKAEAKQEMLSLKNWIKKISFRSYTTGSSYQLTFIGNKIQLTTELNKEKTLQTETFQYITFPSQIINFNRFGIASSTIVESRYKDEKMNLNIQKWINGEDQKILNSNANIK